MRIYLLMVVFLGSGLFAVSKTQKTKDMEIFSYYSKKTPFTLEVENMPAGPMSVTLMSSGEVKPLAKDKKNAVKVITGAWKIAKSNIVLDIIYYNGYACETEPCHVYYYTQIKLPVELQEAKIKGAIIKKIGEK